MDIFVNTSMVEENKWFSFFLTNYLMLIIYDLIPIYLTVIIHYRNLSHSQPKEIEDYQRQKSEQSTLNRQSSSL